MFDNIGFWILDVLRALGIGIINIIFSTIDTLYDVAYKINSLNFIQMLENIENSPFTKIFNAFFILSFIVLLLFSIWKITFKVLDADTNETSLFEIIKEILKCGFLIFCVYLIFNTTMNIGINLSNSIYNTFSISSSTIGDKMKSSYLTINESCYALEGGEDVNNENVNELKDYLNNYANINSVNTMEDFEYLIRNGDITATNIIDAGAFSYRCDIHKSGMWNNGEDYAFNYNFLFGIIVGIVFLFSIGFAVLMLGRRQLELAFLMAISPLVIATSIGRKEQRSALYQQLASLVLQAGAMMLLIGLTAVMFNAIQNSSDINNLGYFTKVVAQSILYLGCAMLLMTGCTSLNRFIGDNVSANSGRDMMLAMRGLAGGLYTAGKTAKGSIGVAKNAVVGGYTMSKGIGQLAKGGGQTVRGMYHGVTSAFDQTHSWMSNRMNKGLSKGVESMFRGEQMQKSSNPIVKSYGKMLENKGQNKMQQVGSMWNFADDRYNSNYINSGLSLAQSGIANIKSGYNQTFKGNRNIGNPKSNRYNSRPSILDYADGNDRI